jgi:hypothetical protein
MRLILIVSRHRLVVASDRDSDIGQPDATVSKTTRRLLANTNLVVMHLRCLDYNDH